MSVVCQVFVISRGVVFGQLSCGRRRWLAIDA